MRPVVDLVVRCSCCWSMPQAFLSLPSHAGHRLKTSAVAVPNRPPPPPPQAVSCRHRPLHSVIERQQATALTSRGRPVRLDCKFCSVPPSIFLFLIPRCSLVAAGPISPVADSISDRHLKKAPWWSSSIAASDISWLVESVSDHHGKLALTGKYLSRGEPLAVVARETNDGRRKITVF
ncbi:hypothetical protein QYE76_040645 [Lolium multiflorum]|uniref:Uncharacterized protein n=1 Tax=Lolium multiflorum TaxID=4521 RepID=A0AAD8TDB2_LOLMU|nr:hypothetical protein QYE76_040645 [Lolium multiflorum]